MKILICDDHEAMRRGLCAILTIDPDFELVGTAADGPTALKMARELEPDVVVMDARLPGQDGATTTGRILEYLPRTRILGMSLDDSPGRIAAFMDAGASGFVRKDRAYDELGQAIRTLAAGGEYLSASS